MAEQSDILCRASLFALTKESVRGADLPEHPLRVPTEVRTCLSKHLSQRVMLLVHTNELFQNDLAETPGTRR